MTFRIRGLSPDPFLPLFGLGDEALQARQIHRFLAEEPRSAPCRITLEDARPGESLLLLSYEHQGGPSPFRASGPIFVREAARTAFDHIGRVPAALSTRLLSLRAYDREAMMVKGEVASGADLAERLQAWLASTEVQTVHIHYASRGCYAARADRA